MRLAIIARGCRSGAGVELYTHELVKHLHAVHEVTLLTNPKETQDCPAAIVPIQVLAWPPWHAITAFSNQAGKTARQLACDLVHTQGSDASWGDVVTAHSCHRAGMRASLKLEPTLLNKFRKCFSPVHRAVLKQESKAFGSARVLLAVSKRVRRQLRAAYPAWRRKPIEVIYPGVDIQAFSPANHAHAREASRRQFGFKPEHRVFVLVANAPAQKGAERLVRALAGLRTPQARLLIASGRADFFSLRKWAKLCGVADQVRCESMGRNVLTAYAAGDIYASVPEYESFGLSILEAMACGLPVLTTRNAGAAELITPGKEGFLLPALAPIGAIAQAMEYLVQDDEVRQQLGHAARLTAEKYTWDRMAREIEKIYQQEFKHQQSESQA